MLATLENYLNYADNSATRAEFFFCLRRWSLLFLCISFYVSCSPALKLAYVGPLSGRSNYYGKMESQAAGLAVLDFNRSQSDPANYANLLLVDSARIQLSGLIRKLKREQRVLAVVGPPSSPLAFEILNQLDEQKMVMVSASASSPQLEHQSSWFFRLQPSDDIQSEVAASFIVEKLQLLQAVIIHSDGSYGRPLAENFKSAYLRAGGEVFANIAIGVSTAALRSKIALLSEYTGVKVIFLATDLEDSVRVVPILKALLPNQITFFGADSYSKLEVRQALGEMMDGMFYSKAAVRAPAEHKLKNFFIRYRRQYGVFPDTFALNAYDATLLLLNNIAQLKRDGKKINGDELRQAMLANSVDGLGLRVRFTATGEADRGIAIYQLTNGKTTYFNSWHIRNSRLTEW